ncbi:UpxY family transcription antiterminator [bacterium]|nr:UpxY family transcription antiterminator [bacterium]
MPVTKRKWRVLYVRPRWEKKVEMQLSEKDIENFLPLREEIRIWSDRKKKVIVPLFPGYIFVHVNERERMAAFDVAGALKYVHFSGELAEVRPEIIESVRLAVSSADELTVTSERLAAGTAVRVKHGPLMGMRGSMVEYRGEKRVAVSIESIQQTLIAEVALGEIETLADR